MMAGAEAVKQSSRLRRRNRTSRSQTGPGGPPTHRSDIGRGGGIPEASEEVQSRQECEGPSCERDGQKDRAGGHASIMTLSRFSPPWVRVFRQFTSQILWDLPFHHGEMAAGRPDLVALERYEYRRVLSTLMLH